MFVFLSQGLKLNTKLWGICNVFTNYNMQISCLLPHWISNLMSHIALIFPLIPLMSIILHCLSPPIHTITLTLGIESVHAVAWSISIWFTFLKDHSGSQGRVSRAGGALCLIAYQCTMLSAETSLNKQRMEKQTVREKQWNNTSGKSPSLMNWENDKYWKS